MMTPLEALRLKYQPRFPKTLREVKCLSPQEDNSVLVSNEVRTVLPKISEGNRVTFKEGSGQNDQPLKVGILFSGGQAAGGHNVVTALFDTLKAFSERSEVIGFLGGPSGLVNGKALLLDEEKIAHFRNIGGFNLLGSGRTKIETKEQFDKARQVVEELNLDGLVIVGGDDSNTNAAYLAEDFAKKQIKCTVIGVPKTIDGDLKNKEVEISFGYDTAAKVYSEMIGNLGKDLLSAKKNVGICQIDGQICFSFDP